MVIDAVPMGTLGDDWIALHLHRVLWIGQSSQVTLPEGSP